MIKYSKFSVTTKPGRGPCILAHVVDSSYEATGASAVLKEALSADKINTALHKTRVSHICGSANTYIYCYVERGYGFHPIFI